MFLFIPLGMVIALLLYQHLTRLFVRLPLPGIVPKGMALDDSESDLKLVLSGWYVGCSNSWLSLGLICFSAAMPISLFWFAW
jgi:hypothetical protein